MILTLKSVDFECNRLSITVPSVMWVGLILSVEELNGKRLTQKKGEDFLKAAFGPETYFDVHNRKCTSWSLPPVSGTELLKFLQIPK